MMLGLNLKIVYLSICLLKIRNRTFASNLVDISSGCLLKGVTVTGPDIPYNSSSKSKKSFQWRSLKSSSRNFFICLSLIFVMLESRLNKRIALKVSFTKFENKAKDADCDDSHCFLFEKRSKKFTIAFKGSGKINLMLRDISETGDCGSFERVFAVWV